MDVSNSAALERLVQEALRQASLYDIGSYGWLNENDADPEFIGHAMWQTDQPMVDYNALFGDTPVSQRPDEVEGEILIAGDDFCGLMQASLLSIGLSLLWEREAQKAPLSESAYFWLHHADAFLKLAIASDRIRDLLIVACTGASAKSYSKESKRNRRYITPFDDAAKLLAARGLNDQRLAASLAALPCVAPLLFEYIDRRNEIVHEVATRIAKLTRRGLAELKEKFDLEQRVGFVPRKHERELDELIASSSSRLSELREEINQASREIRSWYKLLVDASNHVFQVEYWSRRLGDRTTSA